MSNELSGEYGKSFPLQRPSSLERRAYHEKNKTQLAKELKLLDKEKLGLIIDVLNHPATERLIEQGHITLGAIKPNAHDSKLGLIDDVSAEEELLKHIKNREDTNLEIMLAVSLRPSREEIGEFYEEIRPRLQSIPENGGTVWDRMVSTMISGPTTYFLLYSPNGDAVKQWRDVIGATDPAKADEKSIRGKFAFEMKKNLVHGSSGDTQEEAAANVKHEVFWLRDRLVDSKNSKN